MQVSNKSTFHDFDVAWRPVYVDQKRSGIFFQNLKSNVSNVFEIMHFLVN